MGNPFTLNQAVEFVHDNQTLAVLDDITGIQQDMLEWTIGEAWNRQARINRRVPANATTSRRFRAGTRRTKRMARR